VKYADDLVLLAKEEGMLQGMIERLAEIGRFCGIELNVVKTLVMRISRQLFPMWIMVDQKQPEDVEYFTYLGSMITNDARCTCEIKSRIAMTKAAFHKKKTFHQQIGLKYKEETSKMPHLEYIFICC
jgi:hypothetical protein